MHLHFNFSGTEQRVNSSEDSTVLEYEEARTEKKNSLLCLAGGRLLPILQAGKWHSNARLTSLGMISPPKSP